MEGKGKKKESCLETQKFTLKIFQYKYPIKMCLNYSVQIILNHVFLISC